jgi:hypothetical protein
MSLGAVNGGASPIRFGGNGRYAAVHNRYDFEFFRRAKIT